MKAKKYWILVLVLAACGAVVVAIKAQTITEEEAIQLRRTLDRLTLAGLKGIGVVVEGLGADAEKYGLTKQQLQVDVELRLRQNGIEVLSKQQLAKTPGWPYLYINVHVLFDDPSSAVSCEVELRQKVFLARDPNIICLNAATWSQGGVALVGVNRLKDCREIVKDRVDEFINDYLAANPRK